MPTRVRARVSEIEIVGAEALAELAGLEGVAEAVFGRGRRQPGWFARKLVREGVEPGLSSLVVVDPQRPITPAVVGGYALLARAPSLGAVARGAGVGVIPSLRGRGIGRALLEHALARAHAGGCAALEFLAEPARVRWYEQQGFAVIEEQLTLLALGARGAMRHAASLDGSDSLQLWQGLFAEGGVAESSEYPDTASFRLRALDENPGATRRVALHHGLLGTGAPTAALVRDQPEPLRGPALWSWTPEIWTRTPAEERAQVERGGARFWLTREGCAWLVHRCEPDDPDMALRGLMALRRELAPTTPLLLYPCPAASAWVSTLLEAGFTVAQRSFVVRQSC